MHSRDDIETTLIEFVTQQLAEGRLEPGAEALGPDDDLLGSGLVDSLGVMRLIRFLEERFGVAVPPADVTIEHFMTVGTIADYLGTLLAEAGQSPEDVDPTHG
ncbi:MAG: acyl carrier protein [Acidobacteriota bacterium]